MHSTQQNLFAPAWLRSLSCVITVLLFPGVLVGLAVGLPLTIGLIALPLSGMLTKNALHCLIQGQCPPSAWALACEGMGFKMKTKESQSEPDTPKV